MNRHSHPVMPTFQSLPPPLAHVAWWSYPWALLPLLSCGLLTPITIGHAAARLRSRAVAASAAGYAIGVVFIMATPDAPGNTPSDWTDALSALFLTGTWFGGTIQALALRRRVFASRYDTTARLAVEQAVQTVEFRRELRTRFRHLAATDPTLARELRIGRPDLPRTHDDGGLIDINHAPAHTLITVAGITPTTAQQIITLREHGESFMSAEDLAARTELDPAIVPELAEYTIYLA